MIKPYKVETICPYCSTENIMLVPSPWNTKNSAIDLILCDSEIGGCDAHYAVKITWLPKVTTYKLALPEETEN